MVPLSLHVVLGIEKGTPPGPARCRRIAESRRGVMPRERRVGARPPSARTILEDRWAGRVRSPVERSRGALMRLRFREPIWMSPWEPTQARCHAAVRAAIMGGIGRVLPRGVTISALFFEPGSCGG